MANAVNRLAVVIVVALVAAAAQIASAQRTTSTDVRSFEVVAVAGNKLVVKEQSGTGNTPFRTTSGSTSRARRWR